jgi:serine/threonine protein kinase
VDVKIFASKIYLKRPSYLTLIFVLHKQNLIIVLSILILSPRAGYYFNAQPVIGPIFDSGQLILWSKQIADGMTFLASKNIVHGDLAARNILITGNF